MAALDDAFHKLDRGKEHAAHFLAHLKVTFDKYGIGHEIKSNSYPKPTDDPRPWRAFTLRFSSLPIIDKKDEILLGEAIQNFRSSLDYLAWEWVTNAVKRHGTTLTDSQWRSVQFPMHFSFKAFRGQVMKNLPNITPKQRAFVKRYQPYRHRTSDACRAIKYLTILSNIDKHRLIVPALIWPESGEVNFKINQALQLIKSDRHLSTKREIKVGTKIMTLVLAGNVPAGQKNMHVDVKTAIMPMFPKNIIRPTPPDDVVLVEVVLNRISDVCTEILTKASDEF